MSSRIERLEQAGTKDKEQTQESIKKLISEAMSKEKHSGARTRSHPPSRGGGGGTASFTPRGGGNSKEGDGMAIAVVGGFPPDTRRKTLNEAAKSILNHVGGETQPIEAYAPSTHGSVVLVRFSTTACMWAWLQQARSRPPYLYQGKTLWFGPSRSKTERARNRRLRAARAHLAEVLRVPEEKMEINWGAQQIWIEQTEKDLCVVRKVAGRGTEASLT
eukprot:6028201-Amphidinium_carterae.1